MVEKLFDLYISKDKRVLDGFAGLGTVLDVAADRQIHAVTGLDINPLACLAMQAKLFGIPSYDEVLNRAEKISLKLDRHLSNEIPAIPLDPSFAYTRKWFRPDTWVSLLALLHEISRETDVRVQRLFFVACAQIIRDVASVDPRCTHHLVTKKKPYIDPTPNWLRRVKIIGDIVRRMPVDEQQIVVKQQSVLQHDLGRQLDVVILHPPYLGVIHYHLIHRLATDLFGLVQNLYRPISLDGLDFRHTEIKSKDASTDRTENYRTFVRDLSAKMRSAIKPDGRCIIIIGDQRHKGHLRHPFTDFINDFEANDFELEEVFIWALQNNGGMHVLRRGHHIDHNYVLVLHKKNSL